MLYLLCERYSRYAVTSNAVTVVTAVTFRAWRGTPGASLGSLLDSRSMLLLPLGIGGVELGRVALRPCPDLAVDDVLARHQGVIDGRHQFMRPAQPGGDRLQVDALHAAARLG